MEVPAVVTEYDPRWPGVFERLRDRLDAALAGVAHVTEHVGSTAVGGLAAKPIIDVDVVVTDETAVGPAVKALAAAGWQHEGDLGIKGREAFLPPPDADYHHLYLVVADSGRIAITSTFATSCGRIPASLPDTARLNGNSPRCWKLTARPIPAARRR
jgi:GrpB-like predicted nucleotidyltransferase (UPF0157 family)